MQNNKTYDSETLKIGGHESISAQPLKRNLQTVTIYIHELLNIKKEIKKGTPLNWGLRLFWSLFCLCAGNIIATAIAQKNFNIKAYILNLSPFFQFILALSFLGSIFLLFLGKSQRGAALEGIDDILKQCGYESKE
jgi:hypothetical protein